MHNQLLIFVLFFLKWAHINSVMYRNLVLGNMDLKSITRTNIFEINSDGEFVISIDKAKSYTIQLNTLERFLS